MPSVRLEVNCVAVVSMVVTVVDGIILTEMLDVELEAVLLANGISELLIPFVDVNTDSVCNVLCVMEGDEDGIEVDSCNILEGTLVVTGIAVELNSVLLVSGDSDVEIEVVTC